MVVLFNTGFLQVFFVALNTWLISQQNYALVPVVSFLISFIWSFNVKKIAFGSTKDRIVYSIGASLGGFVGLIVGGLF